MSTITLFLNQLSSPEFMGILLLMLSTFLIGYFAGTYLEKKKKKNLINRLKKEVNALTLDNTIKNIETNFTEIRPNEIKTTKKDSKLSGIQEKQSAQDVIENTKNQYVNYTPKKPILNFENIGFGDKNHPDILTNIEGIGPYIEQKLHEIGIYNYYQISRLENKDIEIITKLIDFYPGRIDRDNWVGQAKEFTLTKK